MHENHIDPQELDLTKPRMASYKQKWKRHQDTVYWVDLQLTQRKGLNFYQTRSNAIILYDTLPAYCISKAIEMKSEEIIYQKVYVSPRPPPKISYKDSRMCDLDSDIAGSSKDTQRIEPKPKTQLSSMVRPVCGGKEEIEERTAFDRDTLGQEQHDDVIDPTSTGRFVCGRIHKATRIGGSKRGARNCFQSTRTVTCSCEKKKQNISTFKSSSKRSEVILIERHFMPICRRVTSTTHSAKMRRK